MKIFNEGMFDFLDRTPNSYFATKNIAEILNENGYKKLNEFNNWDIDASGKYYVIRNNASIIAFSVGNNPRDGFNVISTHGDSPAFTLKPNSTIFENGYIKLNVEKYGGTIDYTWFDRPLSIAGIITLKLGNLFTNRFVNIDKDLLIIPSQAIHINSGVNDKNAVNVQKDMLPMLTLSDNPLTNMKQLLLNYLGVVDGEICEYELKLYCRDKARFVGMKNEYIMSPRLDDLASVYAGVCSLSNTQPVENINVFCMFNSEEIGSKTNEGADSTFLDDTLERISKSLDKNYRKMLTSSFMLSADNAHAIHPNAGEKSDPTNKVLLNKGVVVKHHNNYATDAITASMFSDICKLKGINVQHYACKSDMRCGSTLGRVSGSHVSINTVDIGIPQLAMHSANETMGSNDTYDLMKSMEAFYRTNFIRTNDGIVAMNK